MFRDYLFMYILVKFNGLISHQILVINFRYYSSSIKIDMILMMIEVTFQLFITLSQYPLF